MWCNDMGGARVLARPYQTGQGMKPDAWRPTGVKPIVGKSYVVVLKAGSGIPGGL
jgi:hypothetical protein